MAGMILPIGQYAGATGDGAHRVRRGAGTECLDPTSFAAWGLAHGPVDPVLAATGPWTRAELEQYAGRAGLLEPARLVAGLLARGLLAETPATGPAAVGFAEAHRVVPLAVGLGNTAEQPAVFTVGFFDRALVQLDEQRYEVWSWSAGYDSLWQVCQARAVAPVGDGDPAGLLGHFLTGVHQLAAANALYLDQVVAR